MKTILSLIFLLLVSISYAQTDDKPVVVKKNEKNTDAKTQKAEPAVLMIIEHNEKEYQDRIKSELQEGNSDENNKKQVDKKSPIDMGPSKDIHPEDMPGYKKSKTKLKSPADPENTEQESDKNKPK